MTIIRKLTLFDLLKLQKLVDYVNFDTSSSIFSERNFTPFPLDVLQDFLPPRYRFLQESYVAVDDDEILGLIGVIPDGNQKWRWKINNLVLNTNAYDAGKLLIDYVVNKYGGAGVETFITYIDDKYSEALTLFKDACLFRNCSYIQIWQQKMDVDVQSFDFSYFRKVKSSDSIKLYEFHQSSLYSHFRHSLSKGKKDFENSTFLRFKSTLKGVDVEKFVLEDKSKNRIEGYFSLSTIDKKHYWLDVNLSLPYSEYLRDIVNYSINNIKKQNSNAVLNIYARKYYQGSVKILEILEDMNLKCISNKEVLVKDYWKPIRLDEDKKKSPIIIFPDKTSPAMFKEF